ncbi:hypothetical protein BDP55DRAFT_640339 [Colletotrichum godetiae]|uniref:Uncharacterized protein n=1 Tax=Colletotrichum godetiae TaxID=1209918 RepID=A0AAJ0B0Y7_9PEZI|nr:uncharacterized protein BDP55DRAFT_640339 [Colletotrichum godetiae]KAK1701062.1 hypothetical protein BDP55DRAFT_640339 [Colletotrichum godetiae]
MSFQFEGDFWDRYWTCRVLEADKPTARKYREAASQVWNQANKDYKRSYFQAARRVKRTFIGDYPKVSGTEWIMSYRWRVDLMDAFKFDQTPWQRRRVPGVVVYVQKGGEHVERGNP